MTTTIIDCTKMKLRNMKVREGLIAIENMQCIGKEAGDKKSLSAIHHDKQTDPLVIILEEIIPPGMDIDNGEIYDRKHKEDR